MKKKRTIVLYLLLLVVIVVTLCIPAFALTESEVEAQVASTSKAEVSGNVLIWFLCAVAFLKVSQKIDSFMTSLGINVGHTGGNLLAEAMIAMRSVTMVTGAGRMAGGGRRTGATSGSSPNNSGWFLKGGLAGVASRKITNSAIKTATTQTSAVRSAQNEIRHASTSATATQTSSGSHEKGFVQTSSISTHNENTNSFPAVSLEGAPQGGVILTGSEPALPVSQPDVLRQPLDAADGSLPSDMAPPQDGVVITESGTMIYASQTETAIADSMGEAMRQESVTSSQQQTETHSERVSQSYQSTQSAASKERVQASYSHMGGTPHLSLGGMVFSRSLAAGGQFANDVIGTVARGEVAGSITGEMAAQSLVSYMGSAVIDSSPGEPPRYSDVEIGRGRITGTETVGGTPLPFAMYHVDQYTAPAGEYSKIIAADGTQWYKQYAQDAVERKPYKATDDTVAYHERIIKKLPDPPKRKDRI